MNNTTILENKIVGHKALTFDDILLLPNYTDIKRQDVDLTVALHPNVVLALPILSSPMDTVTEEEMATVMAKNGGLGIIHRNMPVAAQADMVFAVKKKNLIVGAAVGVGPDLSDRVEAMIGAGADVLVVDSSHGHSKFVIEAVREVRTKFPHAVIMAGNIATYDGAKALMAAGADILRVGMGPGSICTTRIITGMGVPQISAISAVCRAIEGSGVTLVADGGIRQIGDMAKALAFGAHAVMVGSLLAGYDQSPGGMRTVNKKQYKEYRGMGSVAAMKKGGAERYGQNRHTDVRELIAEGVEGLVPYKGNAEDYLIQIAGSLKSSFYYLGSRNRDEFFRTSRAIKISTAGLIESHPHEILIEGAGGNYQT